jgi:hypothetical protein
VTPSEKQSLVQWLRLVLSKGPNWVGVFSHFTWGRKQIQFPKRRVFYSLEYRTMEKVPKPSNSVNKIFIDHSRTFLLQQLVPWSEANSEKIIVARILNYFRYLWMSHIRYCVYSSPLLVSISSQMNSVHIGSHCFFKTGFNIILYIFRVVSFLQFSD